MPTQAIKDVLARYGASLSDEGYIVTKEGKTMQVRIIIRGKRVRIEGGPSCALLASGTDQRVVDSFVRKFWFWKPLD